MKRLDLNLWIRTLVSEIWLRAYVGLNPNLLLNKILNKVLPELNKVKTYS